MLPQGVDDMHDFVIYKERAFLVGKPILVSGPAVSHPSWSPTGQYLAYDQESVDSNVFSVQDDVKNQKPPEMQDSLWVYSLQAGKAIEVMRFPEDLPNEHDVNWVAGTDKAFLVVTGQASDDQQSGDSQHHLYVMDSSDGSVREFSPWQGTDKPVNFDVNTSPTQPYALISAIFPHDSFTAEGKAKRTYNSQVVLATPDGNFGTIRLPGDFTEITPMWSPNGAHAYVMAIKLDDEKKAKSSWFSVSLDDASVKPIDRPADIYSGGTEGGLITIRPVSQPTTNGSVTAGLNAIWMETADPDSQNRVLLAGDATDGDIDKTMDCASFISQGSLFVRPISEVPKQRFADAVAAWNRGSLLDQARKAGLALLMYAGDFDDNFPSSRDNLLADLGPYLQDTSLLRGFVYTFPGGPATGIVSPSTTQIGYVTAADGRAVVYADGHCQWISN